VAGSEINPPPSRISEAALYNHLIARGNQAVTFLFRGDFSTLTLRNNFSYFSHLTRSIPLRPKAGPGLI
jgi:hypothetical protein